MTQNIPVIENISTPTTGSRRRIPNRLESAGVFSINILASPGAGKTSLIEQTLLRF